MNCYCNPSFDIRCCCEVNSNEWDNCPGKARTVYFMMFNDCETYNSIEQKGICNMKKHFLKKYNLSNKEWKTIIKHYKRDNK
jgi:hypothetical protein